MPQRSCRFCQKPFEPSRFHPEQRACSDTACQRLRLQENRRQKLLSDPEYRQGCRDSACQWRRSQPGYWKHYRATHPQSRERNRIQQQYRDRRRRLANLANNNSALPLTSFPATVWLSGPLAGDLANNNLAPAHVVVLQAPGGQPPLTPASCKQQLFGTPTALA